MGRNSFRERTSKVGAVTETRGRDTVNFSELTPTSNDFTEFSRTFLIKPDISPIVAYLTLRESFGEPNSNQFDDIKSQWCFHLQHADGCLEIYDWKLETWSLGVFHKDNDPEAAKKLGDAFLLEMAKKGQRYISTTRELAKQAKRHILQNPFRLYYDSAVSLLESAKQADSFSAEPFCRAAFFLFISSFEGFMNLLYELYLNPALRDDRIADRLSREQIDIKIRLAPIYCECFSQQRFDHTTEAFKRFHSLANLRNDFIHANVTTPLKRPIVVKDDLTFVVDSDQRDKYGLPVNPTDLSADDIQKVQETIDGIVEQVLTSMRPRYRHEFQAVTENLFSQVTTDDGELIINAVYD
jgi:hypothetical protein